MDKSRNEEISKLLTLKEACDILKVHPNTLRQWDNKGVLKAVRIGVKKVRRYKKEDIIEFINKKSK
jgi:excisionase family DNA binding protein